MKKKLYQLEVSFFFLFFYTHTGFCLLVTRYIGRRETQKRMGRALSISLPSFPSRAVAYIVLTGSHTSLEVDRVKIKMHDAPSTPLGFALILSRLLTCCLLCWLWFSFLVFVVLCECAM